MKEIIIEKNQAGQRFDKFLFKYFKEAPSSFISVSYTHLDVYKRQALDIIKNLN